MKLTIPAPQNIKRRERFLVEHADYYLPARFEYELLRIANIRASKKLRWETPLNYSKRDERIKETSKMFEHVPKKVSMFKRTLDWFKPKVNRASQRGA